MIQLTIDAPLKDHEIGRHLRRIARAIDQGHTQGDIRLDHDEDPECPAGECTWRVESVWPR